MTPMSRGAMFRLRSRASFRPFSTLSSQTSRRSIILAGAAGCGKTTVGKILAQRLGRPWIDIDDHVLEPAWRQSVADKLAKLGDTAFLAAEAETVSQFQIPEASVVSLSGSNPLDSSAMQHLSKFGVVIYLDYPIDVIQSRLERMKVDRIVGQSSGLSIGDILRRRAPFYDSCYDLRLILTAQDTPEDIADLVLHVFGKNERFVSCRGYQGQETFAQVLRKGLAPDQGLFVPQQMLAPWSIGQLGRLAGLDFPSVLRRVMEYFPLGQLHPSSLSTMISDSYQSFEQVDDVLPLRNLQGDMFLQETFHGPTASFKDLALQLTPRLISWSINNEHSRAKLALLVATSGDTGVAALHGFSQVQIPSVILYPSHGVSAIQKHQMLSISESNPLARVIGVDGDFDFCQKTVKELLNSNSSLNGFRLSAGNSMNWGRFAPQSAYAVKSYLDLVGSGEVSFGDPMDVVVPTGNFGHVLGMYLAKKVFGVPIRRLICASNENDVLVEFLNKGVYDLRQRRLHRTISPSVDILLSSNIERLLYFLSDGNAAFVAQCFNALSHHGWFSLPENMLLRLRGDFEAMACSERDCLATIASVYKDTQVLLDPHTALAVFVARKMRSSNVPMVISATAHFAKFPYAILKALGMDPGCTLSMPEILKTLESIQTRTPMHHGLRKVMETPVSPELEIHLPANLALIRAELSIFLDAKKQDDQNAHTSIDSQ